MKACGRTSKRWLPEIFYISLLGFEALLRRVSFKDMVLFKEHNPEYKVDHILFGSSICFNLFSPFGVGKKLEPLIKDLLSEQEIDSDKHGDNIFFQEIVNLAPIICPLIREADVQKERMWVYRYAIESLCKIDNISIERLERLKPLEIEESETKIEVDKEQIYRDYYNLDDNSFEEEIEIEICVCNFCKEFRKYHKVRDQHVDYIIRDAVLGIT